MKTIYYGICFYYEKMEKGNIIKHLKCFKRIDNFNKQFIITVMTNDIDNKEIIEKEISDIINHYIIGKTFKIIVSFNWGGTIVGLWLSYNYIKNFDDAFFAFFEEDFRPINNNWLEASVKKIKKYKHFVYVGESTTGLVKSGNEDQRKTNRKYKDSIRLHKVEKWTDGGCYFTTIINLKLIEQHLGVFHKGDPTTLYSRIRDGIDYGEVGFPTLLNKHGFAFGCLKRDDYFKHG